MEQMEQELSQFNILYTPIKLKLLRTIHIISIIILTCTIFLGIYLQAVFPALKTLLVFVSLFTILFIAIITISFFYIPYRTDKIKITKEGIHFKFFPCKKWTDILSITSNNNIYIIEYKGLKRFIGKDSFLLPSDEESLKFKNAISKFYKIN